jgi:hypothetical protein
LLDKLSGDDFMKDDDIPKHEGQQEKPADDGHDDETGTEMPGFLKPKPPVRSAGAIQRGQHWPYW